MSHTNPWQSVGLLMDSAAPERPQLIRGGLWLLLAAALEALGPILGKRYIDHHLLPGHYDLGAMAALLAAVLLTGWAASWIRYAQLSRMAGVARRSVLRLRELRAARPDRSVIVIAHRLSAVMVADEVIVLKQGHVIERGTHAQLLELGGWYAAQWRYQPIEASLEAE